MSNQIRVYTPQAARDYSRAIDSVHAKIMRTFTSLQEPESMAEEQRNHSQLRTAAHNFIESNWSHAKCGDTETPPPQMDSARQQELKTTAEDIMIKFLDEFLLNVKIQKIFRKNTTFNETNTGAVTHRVNTNANGKELPGRTLYRSEAAALDLIDIHANHVTNESLSRLKSFGLSDVQSYKTCGFLICKSIDVFHDTLLDMPAVSIKPTKLPALTCEENISRVTDFWRQKQSSLEALHFNDSLKTKYRA